MQNVKASAICRACLSDRGKMHALFTEKNSPAKLSEMLVSCTQIQVTADDGLPDKICYRCLQQLSKAFKFKEKCTKTDLILREQIPDNTIYDKVTSENTDSCNTYDEIKNIEDEPQSQNDICTTNNFISEVNTSPIHTQVDHHNVNADKSENNIQKNSQRKTRSHIKKMIKNITNSGPHICPHCNKELKTYSSLKYHMQLHSKDTPFLCSECGEGFKTKNSYDGHMSMHDLSNPHKCDQCGKRYRQAASLRNHVMNHTGERPFLCMICGKGCIQKSDFKKHMLTHSNVKSYVCNICGNEYRFSHNLRLHMRSHTGEKPFDCKVCNKRFSAKDHLKRHSLIHTGEKPYNCDFCEKSFNRASTLAAHRKIHTGQRDHICNICGRSFIQAHCLQTHMNIHKRKTTTDEVLTNITSTKTLNAENKSTENIDNSNIINVVLKESEISEKNEMRSFVNITEMVIEPDIGSEL